MLALIFMSKKTQEVVFSSRLSQKATTNALKIREQKSQPSKKHATLVTKNTTATDQVALLAFNSYLHTHLHLAKTHYYTSNYRIQVCSGRPRYCTNFECIRRNLKINKLLPKKPFRLLKKLFAHCAVRCTRQHSSSV